MSLRGKTLFITGASRGIGLAIALRAARDGANVAIAAKTAEPHPKLPGTIYTAAEGDRGGRRQGAAAASCDIRDEEQVAGGGREDGRDVRRHRHPASTTPARSASPARSTTPMKRYDLMHGINTRGTFLVLAGVHPAPQEGGEPAHPQPLAAAQHGAAAGSRRTSPTRWRSSA